jgi:hypothetical protein
LINELHFGDDLVNQAVYEWGLELHQAATFCVDEEFRAEFIANARQCANDQAYAVSLASKPDSKIPGLRSVDRTCGASAAEKRQRGEVESGSEGENESLGARRARLTSQARIASAGAGSSSADANETGASSSAVVEEEEKEEEVEEEGEDGEEEGEDGEEEGEEGEDGEEEGEDSATIASGIFRADSQKL